MSFPANEIVLDAALLRRRAEQCARLARLLGGTDAATLEALAAEYASKASSLEAGQLAPPEPPPAFAALPDQP
jgi:hypothetical protein